MCKALPPVRGAVSQPFGANFNPSYATANLKGHDGIDFTSNLFAKLGQPDTVRAVAPGLVFEVLEAQNPDPARCKIVRTLYHCEEHNRFFVVTYAHFSSVGVSVGEILATGEPLGVEGNTGDVYVGSKPVSVAERVNGSKAGTHVHVAFVEVEPVSAPIPNSWNFALDNGSFFRDPSGNYFHNPNHDNGFDGAIDWSAFLPATPVAPALSLPAAIAARVANAASSLKFESRGAMVYRICRQEGLTPAMAQELWATIAQESGFDPNARCYNRDQYGKVVSTDYGLCQLNSHWYIGPTKDVKTPFEALTNPEKCVRVMARSFKAGRADDWIAHRNGNFKNSLEIARVFYAKVA